MLEFINPLNCIGLCIKDLFVVKNIPVRLKMIRKIFGHPGEQISPGFCNCIACQLIPSLYSTPGRSDATWNLIIVNRREEIPD